ncbi:hypothetical protein [Crossiella sp. CA198]|uniref:hypothetical protein n=1 Tax=Crossiella sp. CA198 TaxID=3455607 RepID=UPI003F8D4873
MSGVSLARAATVAALIGTVVGTGLAAPASAAPNPVCTWQAQAVAAPAGLDPQYASVTGADGLGGYSGYYAPNSGDITLLRWTGGVPARLAPPAGVNWVFPRGENRSGTILVDGMNTATGAKQVFTLSRSGSYHSLPVPAGLTNPTGAAINNRGDVVASARRSSDDRNVVLLWEALSTGSGPRVLDLPEASFPTAADLDEDGAVLVSGGYEVFVWRDGVTTRLPEPTGAVVGRAISDGLVIGTSYGSSARSYVWDSRGGKVAYPERGRTAEGVNRNGLIAGERVDGPASVWQGSTFLAELPALDGRPGRPHLVADDGSVFGETFEPGSVPVQWSCR